MEILYCGDSNVEGGLFMSILSLLKNTRQKLNVTVLTMDFDGNTAAKQIENGRKSDSRKLERLSSCKAIDEVFIRNLDNEMKRVNPENSIRLVNISELIKQQLPIKNLGTRFTPCCMLRLYADLIPGLPDKILYLDTDVLARRNFHEIFDVDMRNFEIAGVLDNYGSHFFHTEGLMTKDYLNSGVLLLNLALIRKTHLFEKCRELVCEKRMFMPDQSAINKVCRLKKILPRKFNEQKEMRNDTIFRHFTTTIHFIPMLKVQTIKPWHIDKVHDTLKTFDFDDILGYYTANIQRMQREPVPIFYSISESYASLAAVSIKSLILNASMRYNYEIFIVYDNLKRGTKKRLAALADEVPNVRIRFTTVQRSMEAVPKNYLLNMQYFTLTIYFRLFLADMFPEYSKGIYLDADTVVLGDISKLYETKFANELFAACADPTMPNIPTFAEYTERHLGLDCHRYVNSGVLVMNMRKLREVKFGEHCLKLFARYGFETIAPDQDYINAICRKRMKLLDGAWNVLPIGEVIEKPCLVHFNLFNKPWSRDGIRYEEFFWKYAAETAYIKELKKKKAKYTEKMLREDAESLLKMQDRAREIMAADKPGFKDVAEVEI